MPRPRKINGSKWIKFRVNTKIHNFLHDVAKDSGITVSELCRNAVLYVFFGFLLGEFRHTFPEMKERFFKRFSETTSLVSGKELQSKKQKQSVSKKT